MGHVLYELAQNQDVQDKLRQEIRETYKKNGGTLTYADIKEMKYLDKVFKGTYLKLLQSTYEIIINILHYIIIKFISTKIC